MTKEMFQKAFDGNKNKNQRTQGSVIIIQDKEYTFKTMHTNIWSLQNRNVKKEIEFLKAHSSRFPFLCV